MNTENYRITKLGLDWYRRERVLNRSRVTSQLYSRSVWMALLRRLCSGPAELEILLQIFLVGGRPLWFRGSELIEQIEQLRSMGYVSTVPAPQLDELALQRPQREAQVIQECGRDWKKRNELLRALDLEHLENLDAWFSAHPDWP